MNPGEAQKWSTKQAMMNPALPRRAEDVVSSGTEKTNVFFSFPKKSQESNSNLSLSLQFCAEQCLVILS